jgi:hypothetical protein
VTLPCLNKAAQQAFGPGGLTSTSDTGGLYDGPTPAANPNDPLSAIKALLGGGSGTGGAADAMASIKALLKENRGLGLNPSSTLASMAAGFLGGKGPAAALAGGFGGLAKSRESDQTDLMKLVQMSMLYGPIQQQKIQQQNVTAATNLSARGKVPIGTSYQLRGLPPLPGQTYEDMNDEWMKTQPLPAGALKTVTTGVEDIGKLGKLQQQFVTTAKQLENGEFHTDMGSQLKYKAILADPTGIAARIAPEDANAAQKWNSWVQTQEMARQTVQNAQKGALSDARSQDSLKAIVGGYGSVNDKALAAHLNLLANNTALDINNKRNQIEQAYKGSGRKVPDDFWTGQSLPETPMAAKPVDEIYKDLYGKNYPSTPAQTGGGGLQTTPSGVKYKIINP